MEKKNERTDQDSMNFEHPEKQLCGHFKWMGDAWAKQGNEEDVSEKDGLLNAPLKFHTDGNGSVQPGIAYRIYKKSPGGCH